MIRSLTSRALALPARASFCAAASAASSSSSTTRLFFLLWLVVDAVSALALRCVWLLSFLRFVELLPPPISKSSSSESPPRRFLSK